MATTHPHGEPLLRRRTCLVLLANAIVLAVGCSPSTLTMLMLPFSDNKVPPEYKIITGKKEVTLAVLGVMDQQQDARGLQGAENELAEKVAEHMMLRSFANKEKLKLIPLTQVRAFQNKQGHDGGAAPPEVGKHFKADFVVCLDVSALSLYEKRSQMLYRGNAEIEVSLFDMHRKPEDGESYKVFTKPYRCEFPGSGPRDISDCSQTQFRALFLTRIAKDISKTFIAYPGDERTEME